MHPIYLNLFKHTLQVKVVVGSQGLGIIAPSTEHLSETHFKLFSIIAIGTTVPTRKGLGGTLTQVEKLKVTTLLQSTGLVQASQQQPIAISSISVFAFILMSVVCTFIEL